MDPTFVGRRCAPRTRSAELASEVGRHNQLAVVFVSCLALCIPSMVGCGASPAAEVKKDGGRTLNLDLSDLQPDSHERSLAALEAIRGQRSANFFLGEDEGEQLEKQLAEAPHDPAKEVEVAVLRRRLARQLLKIGKTSESISHYESALEVVTRHQIPDAIDALQFDVAVAYLRLAETENCVHCQNGESCLYPIAGKGIHEFKEGAEKAIHHLTLLLKRDRERLDARWLLNLAHMFRGDYPHGVPSQYLIEPRVSAKIPRFPNIARDKGLDEVTLAGGVVIDDFNGDGWFDMIVSNWDTNAEIRTYMGVGGGDFRESTPQSGLAGLFGGLNMIQADYDNDGDLDVYVLRGAWMGKHGRHPNSLLANDGAGRFRDVTFEAGLGEQHFPSQTAAWGDYDNDGDVDLYVGNEIGPCKLFENQGDGSFVDVAIEAGVTNDRTAKGVVFGDYDGDRLPDIYVSNLEQPNRLYHNNGDGSFRDVALEVGVAEPKASFPVWFWDYNNDGALDLYVPAYSYPENLSLFVADYLGLPHAGETDRLFAGDGHGGFTDVSVRAKLDHVSYPMGANFGDINNDGFPDFYLGTGFPSYSALIPSRMFQNIGGREFSEVTTNGGFGHLQKGHAIAFADLDHDGDQDIFMETGGALAGDGFTNTLFENPGFSNHWIAIKLVGQRSNRSAIGARIHALIDEDGKTRSVYKWVTSGGSFGANPLRQHLGLGAAKQIRRLDIFWPTSNTTQSFDNVDADQWIEVTEGDSEYRALQINSE